MNPLDSEEAVRHRAPRVARGRNQHIHFAFLASFANKISQQARHKTCPDVFESERRPVEKFQTINVSTDVDYRRIERKCLTHNSIQHVSRDVFVEVCPGHEAGNFMKRAVFQIGNFRRGYLLDFLGHIQPLVARQALHHGLFEGGKRGMVVGTIILHII